MDDELLQTSIAAGGGFIVYGLTLPDIAAFLSIILLVITISDRGGITKWIKKNYARLEKLFKK